MLWGRKEHEVEVSMLAYGRGPLGAGVLPVSLESLVERSHRALLVGGCCCISRGYNRCLVITPGSLLGRVTLG